MENEGRNAQFGLQSISQQRRMQSYTDNMEPRQNGVWLLDGKSTILQISKLSRSSCCCSSDRIEHPPGVLELRLCILSVGEGLGLRGKEKWPFWEGGRRCSSAAKEPEECMQHVCRENVSHDRRCLSGGRQCRRRSCFRVSLELDARTTWGVYRRLHPPNQSLQNKPEISCHLPDSHFNLLPFTIFIPQSAFAFKTSYYPTVGNHETAAIHNLLSSSSDRSICRPIEPAYLRSP